jgi:hypothetical protein
LDVSRITVKQSWWRQFLTTDFISRYPNFKAACFFEFIKGEEETMRDFTNLGAPPNSQFAAQNNEVKNAFVEDAKTMMPFIQWANFVSGVGTNGTASGKAATNTTSKSAGVKSVGQVSGGFWAAGMSLLGGLVGALML